MDQQEVEMTAMEVEAWTGVTGDQAGLTSKNTSLLVLSTSAVSVSDQLLYLLAFGQSGARTCMDLNQIDDCFGLVW